MSTYSVAQAEALSGIKAHTLRIWERRYGFLKPNRTDTNIRYYSDAQMRKLLNIGILTRNGFKISQIDNMLDEEINDAVADILISPSNGDHEDDIQSMTLAMLELDENSFNRIFQKHVNRIGIFNTILELIYPFLYKVGVLWGTSKAMPAQEHFVTNLIRQKLIVAIDSLSYPNGIKKSIVLFLPEGEMHELGLLFAAYIAKDMGWKVYYLGASVPYENIKEVVKITNSDLMMTISVVGHLIDYQRLIASITRSSSVPLLISGSFIGNNTETDPDQVIPIADPYELIRFLKAY